MPPQTLVKRMETLETRMTSLEQLPARMTALESQVSQLREEMRAEFSAIRVDIRGEHEETRRALRTESRVYYEHLIERLKLLYEGRDPSVGPLPPIPPS